jgi:2-polyprenyl-3-methyl-5-hydroxy-6-metoxy-1,4-benzoquinol methylase
MPPLDRIATETLVDQSYWDRSYAAMRPTIAGPEDRVRQWIEAHVPRAKDEQHCLEVGCFPGRYLGVLGQLGYVVHGVDLTPTVARMKPAFDAEGLRTGDFQEADFLSYSPDRKYDIVCSFGFIEHFTNWADVLRKHAELVRPGGLLVIETPNFRGTVQHLLHRWLDHENYLRHHIAAMEPAAWAALLQREGFVIQQSGWFGSFEFWHDTSHHGLLHRMGFRVLRSLTPWLKRRPEGGPSLSPYCGLIARKA